MTVEEILEAFATDTREFPEEAVRAAVAQPEVIAPALLSIVESAAEDPEAWAADPRVNSTLFALFLLGQFRERAAYRPVARLAQGPPEVLDEILGDFITEGLPQCLASLFDGDLQPLKDLIENAEADEFARCAGLTALVNLALAGVLERTAVLDYLGTLIRQGEKNESSVVLAETVNSALELYPDGLVPDLERAFAYGWVDTGLVSPSDLSRTLKLGRDRTRARTLQSRRLLIEDTVREFSTWACWMPDDAGYAQKGGAEGDEEVPGDPDPRIRLIRPLPPARPVRSAPKIGRNEPCPCGSGKKHKKCCGRAGAESDPTEP